MPGRARTKRAAAVLLAVAVAMLAAGCAGADHTWQGEFTARLEGARASIEAARKGLDSATTGGRLIREGQSLAQELAFKSELIAKLDAPSSCRALNEEGGKEVFGIARFSDELEKNETPYLRRHLPGIWKEKIAAIGELEHEAETCA